MVEAKKNHHRDHACKKLVSDYKNRLINMVANKGIAAEDRERIGVTLEWHLW